MPESHDLSPVSRRGFLQRVTAAGSSQLRPVLIARPELPRFSPAGRRT
jgi:hypothetical protein